MSEATSGSSATKLTDLKRAELLPNCSGSQSPAQLNGAKTTASSPHMWTGSSCSRRSGEGLPDRAESGASGKRLAGSSTEFSAEGWVERLRLGTESHFGTWRENSILV